ncbi:hypothetical protein MIR68_000164 [Amoeboaphelidium protococcarum]|nr:hypothetical protein MIR68_000164 [Amoeboaphelidium protococcarum]
MPVDVRAKRVLVVFDFDWTMIEDDSDHHIVEHLALELVPKIYELKQQMQWTDLMHHLVGLIHDKLTGEGCTAGECEQRIKQCLRKIKLGAGYIAGLKQLKSMPNVEAKVVILSDANHVFISEILEGNNASHLVDSIITNPAHFDQTGRLNIERHWKPSQGHHGCTLGTCTVNICKGRELLQLQQQDGAYDLIFYGGDGRNDFCPILKLSESDHALVRKGKNLERLILRKFDSQDGINLPDVKAQIHYWDQPEQVMKTVCDIVQKSNPLN